MTEDERRRWEERHRGGGYRSPEDVAPTLRAAVDFLPDGRALDVATGLGRNARFLADGSWEVDAIDISRSALTRARERAAKRSLSINWILGDVDEYGFPERTYDVVTVSFFDARHRLSALRSALAPGGVLFYEHHLRPFDAERGPSDRYRFASNELLEACLDLELRVLYYVERDAGDGARVTLIAQNETGESGRRRYPTLDETIDDHSRTTSDPRSADS